MSKAPGFSFKRPIPDNITEALVAVLSSRASLEFRPLFDIVLSDLRKRNLANGGEEMLRLRVYEKLQGLVGQGAVDRIVAGTTKKYKGVAPRLLVLSAEMKVLRGNWNRRRRVKAAVANLIAPRRRSRAAEKIRND